MKVTLTGWKTGLKTVSLIEAIKAHSGLGLVASKALVDELLEGEVMSLEFESKENAITFQKVAQSLGAICQE